MVNPPTAPARPSLIVLAAAAIAGPLYQVVTVFIGMLLIALGGSKLLPAGTVTTPVGASGQAPTVDLLSLATGGVITAPWGPYLIGAVQIALGIGLLVPASRPLAGLGCLLTAVVVIIGFIVHLGSLTDGNGLNQAGIALIMLVVILCAGAAAGTRAAARRIGVAT